MAKVQPVLVRWKSLAKLNSDPRFLSSLLEQYGGADVLSPAHDVLDTAIDLQSENKNTQQVETTKCKQLQHVPLPTSNESSAPIESQAIVLLNSDRDFLSSMLSEFGYTGNDLCNLSLS